MVVLMVILTIVLFIAIDYSIQKRKRVGVLSQSFPGKAALSQVLSFLPDGVFLQPSFTWTKLLDSGNLLMGIHPVILGLVGEPDEIEMLKNGQGVKKGDTLLKIHKGNKVLDVVAPINGMITGLNNQLMEDSTVEKVSQNWIYSIKPENVSAELPKWLIADKAKNWMNEKYAQMKKFFQESVAQTEMGITMADGGDLPFGILSQFDEKTWEKFEKDFCQQK
jgi:glycine cleavage system H lipoate-binding protein